MKALIVSAGYDTGGQGARFAAAAGRWGRDPDVLAVADGELVIRSAHRKETYIEYPVDLTWGARTQAIIRQLADESDVLHLNDAPLAYIKLRQTAKPALMHFHGTHFRRDPSSSLSHVQRWRMLPAVSTIDLLAASPELHWLPTAYNLDELAAIREKHRRPRDGKVRVVAAPTNRKIKSTHALQAAVKELHDEGLPIELEIVEGKPWAECLATKARGDVYFDQVGLGYGCNAVEAWGMGIPVVAGADETTLARMRKEFGGELPFYPATETTIAAALRSLIAVDELREEWGARGLEHARRFHADKPALARLAELYAKAITTKGTGMPSRSITPGTRRIERRGRREAGRGDASVVAWTREAPPQEGGPESPPGRG